MRPKPGASRSEDPSSLASGTIHASERSRGLLPHFRFRNRTCARSDKQRGMWTARVIIHKALFPQCPKEEPEGSHLLAPMSS